MQPSSSTKKQQILMLLKPYQDQVEHIIHSELPLLGEEGDLLRASLYALQGSAKRFRPAITLMIGSALSLNLDLSLSALSVELFHTASLIADDLPLMDDDAVRRSRPSTHIVYGSDVALLSTYALIGAGYQCILKQKKRLSNELDNLDERTLIAVDLLAQSNGLKGVPQGQWLDLSLQNVDQESLESLFYKKTILFFETAFAFGWLFGGGELSRVDDVKQAAYHFGMAFQIYDDLCDLEQDRSKDRCINYALSLGEKKAIEDLIKHSSQSKKYLESLNIWSHEFEALVGFLTEKIEV